jgi:hypothetical protein
MTADKKDRWLKVFCPQDACLAEEERLDLPTPAQAEAQSEWLEIFCPEESCEVITPTQLP